MGGEQVGSSHCGEREEVMRVERFTAREWAAFSEDAHRICFEQVKPAQYDRIDFALLVVDDEKPCGYVTVREHDPETVYWQFGGAFPGTKDTAKTFRGYQLTVDYTRERYKRITTRIENTNIPMLKMAMKVGFRIIGTRTFKGSILVELLLEF